ncbi:MAG: HU family DNA-binding protein [Tannerella sp.]|jgi:DNA-binding protein HU-beta|nr:HU family DNA-binding protein [Tannerella sp.]
MNKTELIDAVAAKAGLSKVDARKALEAVITTVSTEVEKGEKVAILGFGTFSTVEKAARRGVNPQTKQAIDIPARKVVKFKVGAELAKAAK